MDRIRKMLVALLFLPALSPVEAQERTDTAYTFRFVPADDMFYVPWNGNGNELARLESCVSQYKERILGGEIPLMVDGHAGDLAVAKTRSNRVKSELIIRQGLTEDCFITENHAGDGDYVTVTVRASVLSCLPNEGEPRDSTTDKETVVSGPIIYNKVEKEEAKPERTATFGQPERESVPTATHQPTGATDAYTLSLRANLLRWATLTPDLGIGWRISPSWGILVNGSWTSWSWSDKDRRYALWEVTPEVRYYMGSEKRGYLGAMYKVGGFNYKLSATGKQGDLMGGGITGGYQLRLNKSLSMDFNIGIGCLHADYKRYTVTDGVRVRDSKETDNWWGPVNAGVTLVWKLF